MIRISPTDVLESESSTVTLHDILNHDNEMDPNNSLESNDKNHNVGQRKDSQLLRDLEIESFASSHKTDLNVCTEILTLLQQHYSECCTYKDSLDLQYDQAKVEVLEQNELLQQYRQEEMENQNKLISFYKSRDESEAALERATKTERILQYELQRVETIHCDLQKQALSTKALNEDIVQPVLEKEQMELKVVKEEVSKAERDLAKSTTFLNHLNSQYEILKDNLDQEMQIKKEKKTEEAKMRNVPIELRRYAEILHKKEANIMKEIEKSTNQLQVLDGKVIERTDEKNKIELEYQQATKNLEFVGEKLQRSTEERDSIANAVSLANNNFCTKAASRVQIEILIKESDENARHEAALKSLHKKQLDRSMRLFLKKRSIVDKKMETVASLNTTMANDKQILHTKQAQVKANAEAIENLKDKISISVIRLLEEKDIENETRKELESILATIDEREVDLHTWKCEVKKLRKMISVLKDQIDVQKSKTKVVSGNVKDILEGGKLKAFTIMDIEKALKENNRQNSDLKRLYKSLKHQKEEFDTTVAGVIDTLGNIRKRHQTCLVELNILHRSLEEKKSIFEKEKDSHESSRRSKAMLRVEKANAREHYRELAEAHDRGKANVERLKTILGSLHRDGIEQSTKNRLMLTRNEQTMGLLQEKKSLSRSLLKKINIQEETLKRGELSMQQKNETYRAIRTQILDIERYMKPRTLIKNDISIQQMYIQELKDLLKDELNQIKSLSECIENPPTVLEEGKWRTLGGKDLDEEQIEAKSIILLHRLSEKKEELLEKQVLLEELVTKKELLERELEMSRVKSLPTVKNLNEYQARVREATRRMMALVSELSMYQATALSLEDEIETAQEKIKYSRNHLTNDENGKRGQESTASGVELNSDYTVNEFGKVYYFTATNSVRTTAEPRKSFYFPEVGLGLPTPFSMQPMKPTKIKTIG